MRGLLLFPMLLTVLVLAGCTAAPATPLSMTATLPRVVSINPCVDAILVQVADPAQIAGISHYSQDPRATSIALDVARRYTATSGSAEEVVALAPDLVIAGAHVAPSTIAALKRMHIRLLQLPVPATIADSNAQILAIAAAAGQRGRGQALVDRVNAAVARASGPPNGATALIWQGGGLVPGAGTLADELLRVSGFRNASRDYALAQWDVLPLEYLVGAPPRLLLSVSEKGGTDRMLNHPVLQDLRGRIAVRAYPERLLHCGGPTIIDAVTRLAAIRRSL